MCQSTLFIYGSRVVAVDALSLTRFILWRSQFCRARVASTIFPAQHHLKVQLLHNLKEIRQRQGVLSLCYCLWYNRNSEAAESRGNTFGFMSLYEDNTLCLVDYAKGLTAVLLETAEYRIDAEEYPLDVPSLVGGMKKDADPPS